MRPSPEWMRYYNNVPKSDQVQEALVMRRLIQFIDVTNLQPCENTWEHVQMMQHIHSFGGRCSSWRFGGTPIFMQERICATSAHLLKAGLVSVPVPKDFLIYVPYPERAILIASKDSSEALTTVHNRLTGQD